MTAAQFRTVQQPLDPTTAVGEIALFDAGGNPLDLSGGGQKITSVKATALAAGTAPTATLANGVLTSAFRQEPKALQVRPESA